MWVGGVEWVVMWWKCLCDMPSLSRWCDVLVGGVWWYMLIVVSLSILVWYKAATSLNSQPQLPHPNSTSTNYFTMWPPTCTGQFMTGQQVSV